MLAGKTTTIRMLSGLFLPTSGNATLYGKSILYEMDEIREITGVCPQHDILWNEVIILFLKICLITLSSF